MVFRAAVAPAGLVELLDMPWIMDPMLTAAPPIDDDIKEITINENRTIALVHTGSDVRRQSGCSDIRRKKMCFSWARGG